MISRISIIAAVGLICFACALVGARRSAHEVAIKCTKAGWNADASALGEHGGPVDMAELLEDACIYLRVRFYGFNLTPYLLYLERSAILFCYLKAMS